MNKLIQTALISAGLAAAVPQAFAQAPGTESGPQARHSAHGQAHGQRAHRSPTERVEAQLAYLKTALKITGEQETQWNAFADVRRKQAREAGERMEKFRAQMADRQKGGTPPTAIERLERRQAMMATASTQIGETLSAAKPLYAALSPEQQKIADEVLVRGGRGGPGHRGGGHGPRGNA